jgi:ABC-type amino acid transport system permease subunit
VIKLSAAHLLYLVEAARWTILLSLIAFVGGAIVGLPLAIMRVSANRVVRGLASAYIQLLASVIGFVELSRAGQIVNNSTFEPFLIFACVGAIYFALCYPLSLAARTLERRVHAGR